MSKVESPEPLVFGSKESCEAWLREVGRYGMPHQRNASQWIITCIHEGKMYAYGTGCLVFLPEW